MRRREFITLLGGGTRSDALNVNGTVWEDGTFGATIGFQPVTGKFSGNQFERAFKCFDCQWRLLLTRAR
jgi:hypothetical protein